MRGRVRCRHSLFLRLAWLSLSGVRVFVFNRVAPGGAGWIQEHYTYDFDQETFSYYGPINLVALNMGYHNEHHDLPSIPWNNLPKLRAMAPEFYNNLKYHSSWSRLLFQFVFDKRYSLYSRAGARESGKRTDRTRLRRRPSIKWAILI